MIKFLKEKGFAILLLSVIFTSSSLFWTRGTAHNQEELSGIKLGWPISFVVQDYSQLSPPEWWWPNRIGLGTPQEYPVSFRSLQFYFSVALNFLIIFNILFVVLELNPRLFLLRKIISVKYIIGAVGVALLALITFFVILASSTRSQMGVGIPPPYIVPPQPIISSIVSAGAEVQTAQPLSVEDIKTMLPARPIDESQIPKWKSYTSQKLGVTLKYPPNYLVVEVEETTTPAIGASVSILIMEDTLHNREYAKKMNPDFDYVIPEDRRNVDIEPGQGISLSRSVANNFTGDVTQWFGDRAQRIFDRNVYAPIKFLGIDSVAYKGEGLFTFDGVIFEKKGYLYQFGVQYDSPTLAPRSDFYKIISTVRFE
ncbi:MAG: hypothetical protein Q7K40_02615 [bacterium]|nr:hypothetical protein [bacterium]